MRQILQNLSSGETLLAEVPAPGARAGRLLVETEASLVSLGTERMLIDFGKANLLQKALQQPEKVRQVIQKVKTDGLWPTLEVVRARLDTPLPLGYCNVGRVVEVGVGVEGFAPGDRVLSNSPHAEVVCPPRNLCARVPEGVSAEAAAFGVVGAIALQGIRLLEPTIGETMVVTGLGLIGQLAVQILLANGCRVIGIDTDPEKCRLARSFGAEAIDLSTGVDPIQAAADLTGGLGVDGVLLTAATKSDGPVHQAASMCRKRGRIVLVGVVGLALDRADFYEKEISFRVSCAYGPGRYDPAYEEQGHDYPYGFVRWTEQRNFAAVLRLMETGRLRTEPLVSHRFPFDRALDAYSQVGAGGAMGIVLAYPAAEAARPGPSLRDRVVAMRPAAAAPRSGGPAVGLVGAGSFTSLVILPALAKTRARLAAIASGGGVSAAHLARKFSIARATTDARTVLDDPAIDTVFITTRHASHGGLVRQALEAGKHVFVEKPLCIDPAELAGIEAALAGGGRLLMVGFNRRFAPLIREAKRAAEGRTAPLAMVYQVNAGVIPRDHWSQSREEGGGRVIGEACHFVDTLRFLAGAPIAKVDATYAEGRDGVVDDVTSIQLGFGDGSIGTVHYFGNGNKDVPREHLDVYCGGGILRMDNFRTLTGHRWPGFRRSRLYRQDKGHAAEVAAFIDAVAGGGPSPIPWEEILDVTRATFAADAQRLPAGPDVVPAGSRPADASPF